MGIGVRTKKFIPSKTKIGCYLGILKNINDKKRKDEWRYDFQYLFKKYYVDGSDKLSIMSYVNHSSNDDNVNVLYELHYTDFGEECHIVYETKKDIEMNEELFIDYGNDYWKYYHKEKENQIGNKRQRLITNYFHNKS
jgi:SET domain-containing protein